MQNKLRSGAESFDSAPFPNGHYTLSAKVQDSPQHDGSMQEPRRGDLGSRARQALKTRQPQRLGKRLVPPLAQILNYLIYCLSDCLALSTA